MYNCAAGPDGRFFLCDRRGARFFALDPARRRLQQLSIPDGNLTGVEALAASGERRLLAASSHARRPDGATPDEDFRIYRLALNPQGEIGEIEAGRGLLTTLVEETPFLADALRRTPARSGLNLGGIAWTGSSLLVGLRAPTITESRPRPHGGQEDAVVLRIGMLDAMLQDRKGSIEEIVKLDLHGLGIHDLAWDAAAGECRILAGLSADPGHAILAPWSVWSWKPGGDPRLLFEKTPAEQAAPEAPGMPTAIAGPGPAGEWLLLYPGRTASQLKPLQIAAAAPAG